MINSVILVGRTTKDIELAYTRNNKAYTKFTLAVNRGFKDEQGNQQADFIRIVAWGKQAENAAKFVKKGSLIAITGRIETGSYDDNGTTRYTTDVVANQITFLETKKSQQEAGVNHTDPHNNGYPTSYNHDFSNPTRYTTDVVANQITFLETKKSQQEAGVNHTDPHNNGYPTSYNHDFSNPNFNPNVGNPNNPFQTATTMAGRAVDRPLIDINDDDLPF